MQSFSSYLTESGIQHLEHPSDLIFDGPEHQKRALRTIRAAASGKGVATRKLDDKFSFHTIVHEDGRVGVKYKGSGSRYNYTHADIDGQHKDKPHVKEALHHILKHVYKILPHRPGEYQGGLMSHDKDREEKDGYISHTPNTITYRAKSDSEEASKLRNSKISLAIHTEMKNGKNIPLDASELNQHPDVHIHSHEASSRAIPVGNFKKIHDHLSKAEELAKTHQGNHLKGHEKHLRMYVNSTVDKGTKPSTDGYKAFISERGGKEIDKLKSEGGKQRKREEYTAMIHHVEKHQSKFDHTFALHHHIQQATNHIARSLDHHGYGDFETQINGEKSGGEGYVMNGMKIVDRQGFSKANRARTAILRAKKK